MLDMSNSTIGDQEKVDDKLSTMIDALSLHPVYRSIDSLEALRVFMSYHVLAVWDFMSLLKSLQNQLTCTRVPWTPSIYPKEVVRMINEIVLGEESDLDRLGKPCDHFTLYIEAMKEVGADTSQIDLLLSKAWQTNYMEMTSHLTGASKNFVRYNLELSATAPVHQVASAFFYGREKAIPSMFESIVKLLKESGLECPTLIYYLERHIELDGDEHGELAGDCLKILCGDDQEKWAQAYQCGKKALSNRADLWDQALSDIKNIHV